MRPQSLIRPAWIEPGDALSCIAPAGIVNPDAFRQARQRLENLGFRLKTYRDITQTWRYCAGDEQARLDELHAAFSDPETKAVLPVRGGFGCTHLLDRIDYDGLRGAPKWFVGFSDNTVLHAALHRRCGWLSIHGPHLSDGLGAATGMPAAAERSYWRALMGRASPDAPPEDDTGVPRIQLAVEGWSPEVWNPGVARGRLVGGNLSLVCTLLGTPFEWDCRGNILLLEETGEAPYRVDRYLSQLRLAGVLNQIAGAILGQFTECHDPGDRSATSVKTVLEGYFRNLGVPILAHVPVGHVSLNLSLPLGAFVELDCEQRRLDLIPEP